MIKQVRVRKSDLDQNVGRVRVRFRFSQFRPGLGSVRLRLEKSPSPNTSVTRPSTAISNNPGRQVPDPAFNEKKPFPRVHFQREKNEGKLREEKEEQWYICIRR